MKPCCNMWRPMTARGYMFITKTVSKVGMRHFCVFIVILAAFSACTGGGKYEEMRQGLQALNALNRADSVLTVTERDEAQTLADYFDRHGTPNDQLLATLQCYAIKALAYNQLQMKDSAIYVYTDAIKQLKANKYNKVAASISGLLAFELLKKGETDKVRTLLSDYEHSVGW